MTKIGFADNIQFRKKLCSANQKLQVVFYQKVKMKYEAISEMEALLKEIMRWLKKLDVMSNFIHHL